MAVSDSLARAQKKYNQKTRAVCLRLNKDADADILEKLESVPNKVEYIRRLIRAERNPEREWLDLLFEIQRGKGPEHYHVGNADDWCIFGKEVREALERLYIRRQNGDMWL